MFIRVRARQPMAHSEAVDTLLSGSQTDARQHTRAAGRVLGIVLISLITACASTGTIPSLYDTQGRIARYVDSGEYEKELAAVVMRAQSYMERRASAVSKPAIVLDIDETSLANWPAYRVNGWSRITAGPCDLNRGPCGIRAWRAMATSKALAPTLKLAQRAEGLGVAVFFITGRPPELRDATARNLRQEGYRPTAVILRGGYAEKTFKLPNPVYFLP